MPPTKPGEPVKLKAKGGLYCDLKRYSPEKVSFHWNGTNTKVEGKKYEQFTFTTLM